MSSFFGQYVKLSLFGQSHGEAIGITIDGLPAGLELDMAAIERDMARRAPGQDVYATARKETDAVEILSGVMNGRLTGQPLCAIIRNRGQHSNDYGEEMDLLRPGHADMTGHVRYYGFEDFRGGGHFSGRLTAPIVFAGAICKQYLLTHGVTVSAEIKSINGIDDDGMLDEILKAKAKGDSVGGMITCCANGVPAGLGAPFFDSVESVLAHLLFSVPGVKAVSFGDGFACAQMSGSAYNDAFLLKDGKIVTETNHSGGVQGGITNGMPIKVTCVLRPTASIALNQKTVSLKQMTQTLIDIKGRHDPCIVPRAVPVIEAMMAIGLAELWKERQSCPL